MGMIGISVSQRNCTMTVASWSNLSNAEGDYIFQFILIQQFPLQFLSSQCWLVFLLAQCEF